MRPERRHCLELAATLFEGGDLAEIDTLRRARGLCAWAVVGNRALTLLSICGTLETDADLRKDLAVVGSAVDVDSGTNSLLNGSLDIRNLVEDRVAGSDAVLAESSEEIVAVKNVQSGFPVVQETSCAVVDSRGASAVLLSLVADELAALKSRPLLVETAAKICVVLNSSIDVGTSVGASAARGVVLASIVGPHAVHCEGVVLRSDTSRKLAAAVRAEGAQPRSNKDHVDPVVLVAELAVRIHITVLARCACKHSKHTN